MFGVIVTRAGEDSRRELFDRAEVTIGRIDSNDLVLPAIEVSRRHARFVAREGKLILVDLKSTQGTWVNGKRLTSPMVVRDAERIEIGPYQLQPITSIELPPRVDLAAHLFAGDPTEARLIRAVVDGEDGSRLVYADWLDERGEDAKAEFLRVQDALFHMAPDGDAFRDRSAQLRTLAKALDPKWRVRVARPPIEGCAMQYACPREWGSLAATEQANVRFCQGCQKTVHYAADVGEARELAAGGACVAIDLTALRWKQDLAPPYGQNVCGHCGLDVGDGSRHCPRCGRTVVREMLMGMMA